MKNNRKLKVSITEAVQIFASEFKCSSDKAEQAIRTLEFNNSGFPKIDWLRFVAPYAAQMFEAFYKRHGGVVPSEPGFIYLLYAEGSPYFKIGKTNNPNRRLWKEISPVMPFECHLVRLWTTNHMTWAENMLHQEFEERRGKGEWFRLLGTDLSCLLANPFTESRILDIVGDQFWDSFQIEWESQPYDEWHVLHKAFSQILEGYGPSTICLSSTNSIRCYLQELLNESLELSPEITKAIERGKEFNACISDNFMDDSIECPPDLDVMGGEG
ncbi:GIY-YIG nuclease family protein [Leptolyngbyaceae cyanobacterium CCMR0082]|uniref:GIY-YIG nuclease family protein n=1 Tax=Adonisia turfae CCMR0082 TaxID=2304604 RepID=A0A6M0SAT0_9CYAN|nr:GIY-YIG nuclease family protein [Adonisia turfae]NEZ65587.1 GIY-YIG nuclease family protein [Adonisia turfae CCMR0082]